MAGAGVRSGREPVRGRRARAAAAADAAQLMRRSFPRRAHAEFDKAQLLECRMPSRRRGEGDRRADERFCMSRHCGSHLVAAAAGTAVADLLEMPGRRRSGGVAECSAVGLSKQGAAGF